MLSASPFRELRPCRSGQEPSPDNSGSGTQGADSRDTNAGESGSDGRARDPGGLQREGGTWVPSGEQS